MSYPYPQITFQVKTYDENTVLSNLPPVVDPDNIINQLENQTVWVLNWPYALKHNDTFTLYGKKAIETKTAYEQITQYGFELEQTYYGFPQ